MILAWWQHLKPSSGRLKHSPNHCFECYPRNPEIHLPDSFDSYLVVQLGSHALPDSSFFFPFRFCLKLWRPLQILPPYQSGTIRNTANRHLLCFRSKLSPYFSSFLRSFLISLHSLFEALLFLRRRQVEAKVYQFHLIINLSSLPFLHSRFLSPAVSMSMVKPTSLDLDLFLLYSLTNLHSRLFDFLIN